MPRLRRLLLLALLVFGPAPALQAATAAGPADIDHGSTNDLEKGRATIDPNG